MKHDDVFVPNEQPVHTYVHRDNRRLENNLSDYLKTKNIVVSISGPSKTGKTVLFRSAVEEDLIIPIPGVTIKSESDFWSAIFSWLGEPVSVVSTHGSSIGASASGSAEGEVGVVLAKAKLHGAGSLSGEKRVDEQRVQAFNPFQQIVSEIGDSDFIIFLDDFHYIEASTQPVIARVIKALAENGVKVVTASVPHKSDDVVRANPELRGRLASIDVESWSVTELEVIGKKGFPLLNVDIAPSVVSKLAEEAFGSPQLMQALCLNLCRAIGVRDARDQTVRIDVTEDMIRNAMEDTVNFANFSSLVSALHSGPKKHGKDRKIFDLSDGTRGDVYRTTLLAIATGEPKREFVYDEVMTRVRAVCIGDAPVGSSVQGALSHMHSIGVEMASSPVLEWDEDTLTITDPYFAFYLRASRKLDKLARHDQ